MIFQVPKSSRFYLKNRVKPRGIGAVIAWGKGQVVLEVGTKGVSAQTRLERFKCREPVLAGGPVVEGALAL